MYQESGILKKKRLEYKSLVKHNKISFLVHDVQKGILKFDTINVQFIKL